MLEGKKFWALGSLVLVLEGCIDPAETARVALEANNVDVVPVAFVSAAASGQVDSMKLLEQAGVSPMSVDPKTGRNALTAAIESGQSAAFEYLVIGGKVPIGARNREGRTPLGVAFDCRNYGMAERLLDQGESVSKALGKRDISPLQEMVERRDMRAADLLMRFGADPRTTSKTIETVASMHLDRREDAALARVLSAETPISSSVPKEASKSDQLLSETIRLGLFQSAQSLAEKFPGESAKNSRLLIQAVADGDYQRLHQLVHLGVDPNATDPDGVTAMEWAVSYSDTEAAEILLQAGCDPTPALSAAVSSGNVPMVKRLLEAGATPDGANTAIAKGAEPPLCAAVSRSDTAMVSWLLTLGADPNLSGKLGQPPLILAAASRNQEMVELLVTGGADPDIRSVSPHRDDFRDLVSSRTLDFYLRKDSRLTPLMMAAAQDDVQTTDLLLKHGASRWLYTTSYKRYAVNFAAERSHVYIQQRLLGRDPLNEKISRKVVVDLSEQRARLFENGKVVYTSRVSTGKSGFRTPSGQYVISNKYKSWTSTIYDSSMPYFQRLSCGSFGFHVGNCPGYAASHGCIRMPYSGAKTLFSRTEVGDFVQIVP